MPRFGTVPLLVLTTLAIFACGGSDDGASPPPGSCRTGGTATGSFAEGCNRCGQQECNAELSDKSGSGWADQYFGGNGSCAAFTECLCSCAASGNDPLSCATTACIINMTPACQAAVQAANDCIDAYCAAECR